jgi:endonuclease/exonuclease/phosphatase family metal-dependent hydrolase
MNTENTEPRRSWLIRLLFRLNILAVISLLLSHLASAISPQKIWWLAMFGIGFGTIAFANVLFLFFWIIRRDRRFLLSLIALILVISKLFGIYELRFSKPAEVKNGIKIMSFNVRLFDLYNWYHSYKTKPKIFELLKKESPDIICFQEFFSSERKDQDYNLADTLHSILSCPWSYIYYSVNLHDNKDHWGTAIYSRFPIVNKKEIAFDSNKKRAIIYADIVHDADTLRVFNVHLESIGFKAEDYRFVENLGEEDQEEFKGAVNILRRLKRAFQRRADQAEMLHKEIAKSPYPVILCGDFNDTPSSYTYTTVNDGMKDAYRISGSGSGKTYIGVFPSFRIDYILHSPSLLSSNYTRVEEKLSDHYPITCIISRNPGNK